MADMVKKDFTPLVLLLLSGFTLVVLSYGGLITENNHQYMPLAYSLEEEHYLENDFYIQETAGFNVRHYFTWTLYLTNRLFRDYDMTQQFLTLVSILAIITSIYFLAHHFSKDRILSFFIAFSTLFMNQLNPAGMALIKKAVSPNMISYAFILAGLNLILRRKEILGYFVLGFGTLFQPIDALLMYVSFLGSHCLVTLSYRRFGRVITSFVRSLAFFVSASLMLVPLYFIDKADQAPGKGDIISFTISKFKLVTHASPFSFSPIRYLSYALFVILIAHLFLKHVKSEEQRRYALPYSLLTLLFLLIGTIFVEIWPVPIVAKSVLFRCLVFFTAFAYFILLHHVFHKIRDSTSAIERLGYALIPVLFFEYMVIPFGLLFLLATLVRPALFREVYNRFSSIKRYRGVALGGTAVLALMLAALFVYAIKDSPVATATRHLLSIYPLLILLVIFKVVLYLVMCIILFSATTEKKKRFIYLFLVLFLFLVFGAMQARDLSSRVLCGGIYDAAEYIKQNTPEDSIFLIPPEWKGFRLCASRAVVVDLVEVFTDGSVVRWHDRLSDVTRQERLTERWDTGTLGQRYHGNNERDIERLREKYDFDYVAMNPSLRREEFSYTVLYNDADVIIYKI